MKYLTFSQQEYSQYEICFLVPTLNKDEIEKYYINPYLANSRDKVLAYEIFKQGKRTPVKVQKEYLEELLPILMNLQIKYLVTCDAEYFKTLTKSGKTDGASGYVLDSIVGDFKVIYVPNFTFVWFDPDKAIAKIKQGMDALINHRNDIYYEPGKDIIKFAGYPQTDQEIHDWLQRLINMDCDLTCDIEAFSLKHYDAGIATISFCWNQHEGIAFPVDAREPTGPLQEGHKLERWYNPVVRKMLAEFFKVFSKKMIWHNITFDVYVLIYQLYMEHLLDTEGLLDGLEILLKNYDDTKLITYLATNSCAGNNLKLKHLAQEFAGNYAQENIEDIRKISLDDLLQYNVVDGLSTWFTYNKYNPIMIADNQNDLYQGLFKDAVVDIIQMQLTGLPIDMEEVIKVSDELNQEQAVCSSNLAATEIVQEFTEYLRQDWLDKKHLTWKKKTATLAEVPVVPATTFNPNSPVQLQTLLYHKDFMNLPILDYTKSKQPSTGADTLEKLIHHTTNPKEIKFIEYLLDYKSRAIIISTFIPALMKAQKGNDGWHYMFGNFNLGGTVSARLSSSDPNLQNIPANGKSKAKERLAKMIKRCIKAPPGWLFVGLDFDSLEDRISALTTKDPNKLKVYTDGYDGHSLRAYFYFSTAMADIIDTVDSINSIKKKYPFYRQESKAPTFALTYQGTFITLMRNCGFSEEKAKDIETKYHEAYIVSDQWVDSKLEQATKDGYVTCAFGLRVRTPLLHQVVRGNQKTPFEAQAEGRTAGNALGQSWCLLNSRAASEFMKPVRKNKYRLQIRPSAHIHDAQYYIVKDSIDNIIYMNKHLVKAVQWQDHPDIYHDDVKLGGSLAIYYPNWSVELGIKNNINEQELIEKCDEHFMKYAA